MNRTYTMIIDNGWGDQVETITGLTKNQVIDIALGEPFEGKKYLNSNIMITEESGAEKPQHIDTSDDFELFGIEFAPGF
jgi:hypothetical protein